ncbi:MAG TPA: putative monovalent cation/H+ antiporter subunit A [Azospirillaceae bacterium]|nr:putative monovalent cation/H+ antiporter subunit A [Azospirillaceae bacterium]
MLTVVLLIFVLAALAPALHRLLPALSHWLLALPPALVCGWFALQVPGIGEAPLREAWVWAPQLGVTLSFWLDGLSLTFALLITGIGAFIVLYSGGYLHGHVHQGRFYLFILAFMGSMLGLVLADNLFSLFVFWELTSVTSFLLIGFNHEDGRARRSAVQALVVTSLGGLAMMAGFVLLGVAGGGFELSDIRASGADLRGHDLYLPILLLVLAGAFTKSAQVPFHFWLPNAMDAPTPVSAYLHSATMVKAGVYLLARLSPTLGGTPEWMWALTVAGGVTAVTGGLLALRATDLKRILAYTTLMALGTLTLLLGMGGDAAWQGFAIFLVAHSLYKGALFMGAGAVDHGTGTRDINELGGLWPRMRLTGAFMALAALSMAGLPPLVGFVGKELIYEAGLHGPMLALLAAFVANACMVAAAGLVFLKPFTGPATPAASHAHEGGPALWLGPAVLSVLGLVAGLAPGLLGSAFAGPTVAAVAGRPVEVDLHLWHGLTPALGLSVLTVALGAAAYLMADRTRAAIAGTIRASRVDMDAAYDRILAGMDRVAAAVTGQLQGGSLRRYQLTVFTAIAALLGLTLWLRGAVALPTEMGPLSPIGLLLAATMLTGAVATLLARTRLAAIVALSINGLGLALTFLVFGAPDVGITQLMVETLTTVVLVLVLRRLPAVGRLARPTRAQRWGDAAVAVAVGVTVTLVLLGALATPLPLDLSLYFGEHSYLGAHGRNVVNVILVDFRGFDTLGEVTVVAIACLGVYSLLRVVLAGRREGEDPR